MRFLLASLRALGRDLRRHPGFLLVVVLTLGVAVAADSAVFTVVDAVLLRPLPFPAADRLVIVRHDAPGLKLGYPIDVSRRSTSSTAGRTGCSRTSRSTTPARRRWPAA